MYVQLGGGGEGLDNATDSHMLGLYVRNTNQLSATTNIY